jgi:alpha-glucosidase
LTISAQEGKYKSPATRFKLVFHGLDDGAHSLIVNGGEHPLKRDVNVSFVALEKFDPIHDPEPAPQQDVHTVDFDYTSDEIVVQY